MQGHQRVAARFFVAVLAIVGVLGCDQAQAKNLGIRQGSMSYLFTITTDSNTPPNALDSIRYTVLVRDRKTRQPIQGGEGQIYAGHPQGPKTWDGLEYGPEVGIYHGWLTYTMAGTWSVNIRFRRDSLSPLETTSWMQDVRDSSAEQASKKKP